jgi:hypothetical protein
MLPQLPEDGKPLPIVGAIRPCNVLPAGILVRDLATQGDAASPAEDKDGRCVVTTGGRGRRCPVSVENDALDRVADRLQRNGSTFCLRDAVVRCYLWRGMPSPSYRPTKRTILDGRRQD